jgi:hypothetical protein
VSFKTFCILSGVATEDPPNFKILMLIRPD